MAAQKTVLITGCSLGGLGDALAQAFHAAGARVIATARNPSKIDHMKALGIETAELDVLSTKSIEDCVANVAQLTGGHLDILVNNSGVGHSMPLIDVDINAAKKCFDLNVWAVLQVTQTFLPLLMKSPKGMVVNNTSVGSTIPTPFFGVYSASKAATAMMTQTLRFELQPFNIQVVEMKTGAVKSKFFENQEVHNGTKLPPSTIYEPARTEVEKALGGENVQPRAVDSEKWAKQVVGDLLQNSPPAIVWRGGDATAVRISGHLPTWVTDPLLRGVGGIDVIEKKVKEQKEKSS